MLEKAQNIDDIMEVFNSKLPFDPIEGEDAKRAWELFYTDSIDVHNDIKKIKRLLLKRKQKKVFLTGARGNGKSSKLKAIQINDEIKEKFDVIYISVYDELNDNDLDFIEVIFLIMSKIVNLAENRDIILDEFLQKRIKIFYDFIIEKIETISIESSDKQKISKIEAGGEISNSIVPLFVKLSLKFKAVLKNQSNEREEIRKRLYPKLTEIIETFNFIYNEIKNITNKEILIIIDDIEKINPQNYEKLFENHSTNFFNLEAYMLITYPFNLKTKDYIYTIGEIEPLSTLKIITKDNRDNEETLRNKNALKELILTRIEPTYNPFEDGTLEYLITQSGGVISLLIDLIGNSAMEVDEGETISMYEAKKAVANQRVKMTRLLTSKDYNLLKSIEDEKMLLLDENEITINNFISTWHIIEYRNDESWYDINPILKRNVT